MKVKYNEMKWNDLLREGPTIIVESVGKYIYTRDVMIQRVSWM